MSEQQITPTELTEEERIDIAKADEVVQNAQYGQSGDRLDPGLGGMGGAGASGGIQPDIAQQSQPTPGNSSDLPKP